MQDNEAKKRLGYKHPKSKVRMDGSEVLHGQDWKKRKEELWARCEGRCEQMVCFFDVYPSQERCRSEAHDPDHIIKRSKHRDDRLSNLKALCRLHHDLKHPEKNKLHWRKHGHQPGYSLHP